MDSPATIIHVSNAGDDANDGSKGQPVRSLKRLNKLCTGNTQILLEEGKATLDRLNGEIEN